MKMTDKAETALRESIIRTNIYLIPSQELFATMAQRWHLLGFFIVSTRRGRLRLARNG